MKLCILCHLLVARTEAELIMKPSDELEKRVEHWYLFHTGVHLVSQW